MLLVRTYIAPSDIDGMGLFANEYIQKGQVVRVTSSHLEQVVSPGHFVQLAPATQEYVNKYGWNDEHGNIHLEFGPEIFTNHSTNPTMMFKRGTNGDHVATRDIHPGEEITSDYREYSFKDPSRPWLNEESA